MLQISHQAAAQYKAFVIKVMLNVVGMLIGQYSDQFKMTICRKNRFYQHSRIVLM
ncbi:hypothetical protein ECNC101_02228 [Escherichia coli NC101]|nr:hypothetical protein ECNC101_02228 [Escherichia coli NC101]